MRIYFTREDLAHTHLAAGPDVMWELVSSLQVLQSRYGRTVYREWRHQVGNDLRRTDLSRRVRALLFPVAPDAAYFPDLLTPSEGALGLEEALGTVLSTPRRRLQTEIGVLDGRPRAGTWLADLSAGRTAALKVLESVICAYHRVAVAPYWHDVRAAVDSDLAVRRQALRERGVNGLLASYRPKMRWQFPVLDIPSHISNREIHLQGRGLVLIPSYFCHVNPMTIFDAELPQVIVYPVDHTARVFNQRSTPADISIDRLLGDTRAAVLRAVDTGCTTGELAVRLGVSPATISHHAGILRDARLITSRRTANTVLHVLSPLGAALLARQKADTHPVKLLRGPPSSPVPAVQR